MIVPGGGISLDGTRWVPCRPDFILPVEVDLLESEIALPICPPETK